MIFIGVDPGKSGAIVALDECSHIVRVTRNAETERDVFGAFTDYGHDNIVAVIEAVHSMPRQGVASSFKFGQSYGFLRGCLIASGIRFSEVTPRQWQMRMKCLTKGDKNVSKARAQQLFPSQNVTHATADALLLAEYCRTIHLVMPLTPAVPEPARP